VKQQGTATVPTSFTLTTLQSAWLTGRYQLAITDHAAGNTGSVSSWDITL
jgi:subtilisin-like proprotein convertase family protein